jgi:transcriptional regulator with XRE-family HTH domain
MALLDEKQAFSKRLKEALRKSAVDAHGYARVAREFNLRYAGDPVSTQAVRKWLTGGALPSQDKIRALAQWLDVGVHWLRFGEADRKQDRAQIGTRQDAAPYRADPTWVTRKFDALEDHHKRMVIEMVHALLRLEGKQ